MKPETFVWPYNYVSVFCVGSVIGGFPSFESFFRPFCGQNLGKNGKFLRKFSKKMFIFMGFFTDMGLEWSQD